MAEIKAPIPKRVPKLVMPKSPAPWDIAAAITAVEHDVYQALIKEPAEAAGITALPELPGPGTIASMFTAPLQGLLGGLTKAGQGGGTTPTPTPSPEIKKEEEKVKAKEILY